MSKTPASLVADVIDDGKASGQQFLVVALCMLFNMVDGFDITAMAIVASSVGRELSLAPATIGLIFSFARDFLRLLLAIAGLAADAIRTSGAGPSTMAP